jgi:hypothetical protein
VSEQHPVGRSHDSLQTIYRVFGIDWWLAHLNQRLVEKVIDEGIFAGDVAIESIGSDA